MNRKGIIAHTGFGTYLLIVVLVIVALYFIAPSIYAGIVSAVSGLAHAVK